MGKVTQNEALEMGITVISRVPVLSKLSLAIIVATQLQPGLYYSELSGVRDYAANS